MVSLFSMWRNTRMVVLVALSAALYAALLIPFKFATIIPGLTEIRPGACVPVVTGILFGPAACWGSGLGNVMGDVVGGMFGPASAFGFFGNFLLSFVAWKLWEAFGFEDDERCIHWHAGRWIVLCVSATCACALVIAWGVDVVGIVPFAFLGTVIFLNNAVVSLALAPLLLGVLQPRATRWGLRYRSIMDVPDGSRPRLLPALVLAGAVVGGFSLLMLYSLGILHVAALDPTGLKQTAAVRYGALPFLAVVVLTMLLL
jgi:energy-coupling factor transport system substrate-specific component